MKPEIAVCVARVRLTALRQMIAAGGRARRCQFRRAFAPLVGRDAADDLAGKLCAGAVVSGPGKSGEEVGEASGVGETPF